jgi:hypothetical protein
VPPARSSTVPFFTDTNVLPQIVSTMNSLRWFPVEITSPSLVEAFAVTFDDDEIRTRP